MAATLWAGLVFSAWVVPQALLGGAVSWTALPFGYQDLSEIVNWLPLAAKVAEGNLLPAAPSLDPDLWGLRYHPYLVVWLHGLAIHLFGLAGSNMFGRLVFPMAAFALMVAIHGRYVGKRWAVALAALSLMGFAGLPLREFLVALVQGGDPLSLAWPAEPDSLGFPIPAITLAAFLAVFYVSMRPGPPPSLRRNSLLTLLWAAQTQVHVVNALVGLPFWFVVLAIRLWRRNGERIDVTLVRTMAFQAALAALVAAPAVAGFLLGGDAEGLSFLGLASDVSTAYYGAYYYVAYFIFPLALLATLYRIDRIDAYELLFKFSPVFLLMAVELFWVLLQMFFHVGLPADLLYSRLGMEFLHIYYFVPSIYYMTRPPRSYSSGQEGTPIAANVRAAFGWLAREASIVYLPAILMLLTAFLLVGAYAVWQERQTYRDQVMAATESLAVLQADAPVGALLVSDSLAVDLLIPTTGRRVNLLPTRFANAVPLSEALDRLALRARLLGWDENTFARFMAPPPEAFERRRRIVLGEAEAGFGYWLTLHKMVLQPAWAEAWDRLVRGRFQELDVTGEIRRFRVSRVLSHRPLPPGVAVGRSTATAWGTLYELDQ